LNVARPQHWRRAETIFHSLNHRIEMVSFCDGIGYH
jgi:hypothetical protein